MSIRTKPKGPTAKARAAKAAKDARYAKKIRARVVMRDGDCRIGEWDKNPNDLRDAAAIGCEGVSEWAHLGDGKRFKTRGLPPEERHTTARSLMLCTRHHRMYDAGTMAIDGADANDTLGFWIV